MYISKFYINLLFLILRLSSYRLIRGTKSIKIFIIFNIKVSYQISMNNSDFNSINEFM